MVLLLMIVHVDHANLKIRFLTYYAAIGGRRRRCHLFLSSMFNGSGWMSRW